MCLLEGMKCDGSMTCPRAISKIFFSKIPPLIYVDHKLDFTCNHKLDSCFEDKYIYESAPSVWKINTKYAAFKQQKIVPLLERLRPKFYKTGPTI